MMYCSTLGVVTALANYLSRYKATKTGKEVDLNCGPTVMGLKNNRNLLCSAGLCQNGLLSDAGLWPCSTSLC
jgi:hypothetical protein